MQIKCKQLVGNFDTLRISQVMESRRLSNLTLMAAKPDFYQVIPWSSVGPENQQLIRGIAELDDPQRLVSYWKNVRRSWDGLGAYLLS